MRFSSRTFAGFLPLLLLAITLLAAAPRSVQAIWPHPKSISLGSTSRAVDASSLKLAAAGSEKIPDDVQKAFERMLKSLTETPLVDYPGLDASKLKEGSALTEVQVTIDASASSKGSSNSTNDTSGSDGKTKTTGKRHLRRVGDMFAARAEMHTRADDAKAGIASEIIQKLDKLDEKYTLSVPEEGAAAITAGSSLGVLRALTTLEQLVYASSKGNANSLFLANAPVKIEDEPAYPYRGLLIDTARNYYTIGALKRQLDAMSLVKMNQFHWHIVDSQSFPLQLSGDLAKLSQAGAYSSKEVYSPDDIDDLVTYAAERGINVNVEIDMPGHTYEGVKDYDESLIACPSKDPWTTYANEPPSGQLALKEGGNDKVKKYTSDLLAAVAKLFPGPYVSHGNDEVNLACYDAKAKSDIDASLLKPFVTQLQSTLTAAGKTPMVWEEAAIDFPETGKALAKGTLVQAWTTSDNVKKILASNADVLLLHSPTDYFYLDCGRGSWLSNYAAQSYCPFVTWGKMYAFDPTNGTDSSNVHRVVGGEACMWGEQADSANVDTLVWPRAAAAAEVFHTGKTKTVNGQESKLNMTEAVTRLNELRYRLVARGVAATPLQPQWCISHPGACILPSS